MAKATYAQNFRFFTSPWSVGLRQISCILCSNKKWTHPHFGVFSYLLGVFPQENNIKLGILHDKREIIP